MSIIINQSTISLPIGYCSIDADEDQIISLVSKYQNSQDKKEKNNLAQTLINTFADDIRTLAKKLSGNKARVSTDELIQIGRLTLLSKAEKFDFSRGVKFWTYARKRILGAMKDEIRSELAEQGVNRHGEQKRPRTVYLSDHIQGCDKLTIDDSLVGENGLDLTKITDCPIVGYSFPKQDHPIYHLGNILSRREMVMLDLYYGLTGKEHEKNMEEIGKIFNVSESRVSQILGNIGEKLKRYETMIARGEFPEESFKHLGDPLYNILSTTARKKDLSFTPRDLECIESCSDLLSQPDKEMLILIRGTDNEYGIPRTNGELVKEWKLTRSRELPAYIEPFAEKLLTLLRFEKKKDNWGKEETKGWFIKPSEINVIFASLDKGICQPSDFISALISRIGYSPLESGEKVESSNKQELVRIINTPGLECHYSRDVVIGVINAALSESSDSFNGKLLRRYPEIFESVIEAMADRYMIQILKEANDLAERNGSITYKELEDIYKRTCHGICPSLRTLKKYAESFKLKMTPLQRGGYRKTA